jgi:hypothetical protein
MPIEVQCSCGTTLRAPDAAAGKKIKCPKCEAIVPVPAAADPAAGMRAAPPSLPPEPAPPMASAAPAPPRRRDDIEEEDDRRPRRRFEEEDDRPRRREPRREAASQEGDMGGVVPLILGIMSIIFSAMAIPLAFMGCCPPIAIIAAGLAGLGLLLGAGGTVAAIMMKRGLPAPLIGVALSLVALAVVLAWGIMWGGFWIDTKQKVQQAADDFKAAQDRWQKEQQEREAKARKQKEDEYNNTVSDPSFIKARSTSQENLKKIAKALLDYEKKHGHLPYARTGEGDKEAQAPRGLSWRVAILPFLGRKDLYDKFNFNEPSNFPVNQEAAKSMPDVYMSPRHPGEKNRTYYQVFTGDGLFGQQNSPPQTKFLARNADSVLMVVEAQSPIEWARPDDINYNTNFMLPQLGGVLPGNHFNAALADGTVVFVPRIMYTDDQLKGLIPFNGGKAPPNWPPPPK